MLGPSKNRASVDVQPDNDRASGDFNRGAANIDATDVGEVDLPNERPDRVQRDNATWAPADELYNFPGCWKQLKEPAHRLRRFTGLGRETRSSTTRALPVFT